MTPIETIDKALAYSTKLSASYPNFQPLESVKAQLRYLKGILNGTIEDRSRLQEIIIGIYAAKEFEERDIAFADLLYDAD
jgi:hypothetical protein